MTQVWKRLRSTLAVAGIFAIAGIFIAAVPTHYSYQSSSSRLGQHSTVSRLAAPDTVWQVTDTTIIFVSTFGNSSRGTRIKSVTLVPDGSVSGAATNTRNLNLLYSADGATWTQKDSVDFGSGTDATSGTPINLYEPSTPLNMPQNAVLAIENERAGTGVAGFPGFLVVVASEGI